MLDLGKAAGFIFDCDGTLLDTLGAWEAAEADLFAQAGPMTAEQEDEIHSVPIEVAARLFHERYGVGRSAQAVLEHLDGHLIPFYGGQARPLPGAVEFVRAVNAAGIPTVVLSSSPRRYLEAGLGRAGILGCFQGLVTTDETGVPKSDPTIYGRALEILGTEASRTWAVDDALYAIRVMNGAGIHTIGVGNGAVGSKAAALRQEAELYVDTLGDLL